MGPRLPAARPDADAERRVRRGRRAGPSAPRPLNGKPQSRRNALRAIHIAGDAAGLNGEGVQPIGLHDLRHSLVAIAFERDLTLPEVALLARHANPRVTATVYAGLTSDGRERAAAKLVEAGFGA